MDTDIASFGAAHVLSLSRLLGNELSVSSGENGEYVERLLHGNQE
jgi:hypothetical protein